jgi:bifunctional DNA-binding transcriptional regulator/antitoxin component of YhaV-PrlF toxin-antitoxin module
MGKVTSKLQVTVPKAIADRYGIRPGDEIAWQPAGAMIQIVPPGKQAPALSVDARLKLYDAATVRQRRRQAGRPKPRPATDRGWRREDLYARGRAR